jgi:hypothetical protein
MSKRLVEQVVDWAVVLVAAAAVVAGIWRAGYLILNLFQ